MVNANTTMHSVNYASTKVGVRVWAVLDSNRQVIETNESLDKLTEKWGNEYVCTLVIAQDDNK